MSVSRIGTSSSARTSVGGEFGGHHSGGFSTWYSRLPTSVGPLATAIGVTAAALIVLFGLGADYYDSEFVLAICSGIVVMGMVVQVGYGHQLAFSQSVFMGLGGYGVAILSTKYQWPMPLACLAVVAAGAVIGALIGSFVTRVPGFALALATLFFAVIVTGVVIYSNYLGGTTGLGGIAPLWSARSFPVELERSGTVAILLLGLCVFVCARIMKSGIGLEIALLGANERMAASIGVMTQRRKLELFVLGSMLATLGGAVFAGTQAFVSTTNFNQNEEVVLLVMLFIGGRSRLLGGLIGAIGIQYLSATNNFIDINLPIIEGILLTVVLLFAPGGVIELFDQIPALWKRLARRSIVAGERGGVDGASAAAVGAEDGVAITSFERGRDPLANAGSEGTLLHCENVTKHFGGVVAVDDVTLTIEGTGIHSICGPNGAGKTTLFELIAGGLRCDGGRILIGGKDVTRQPAFERAQLGLSRTLQMVRLMPNRTVLDNVAVAAIPSHRTFMSHAIAKSDLRESYERARQAIEWVGIAHLTQQRPGQLTLEAQRMVELARAIVARPTLLLLDEPASGLSGEQRARLADTLLHLAADTTVVLVEHDVQMVARISAEVFVLIDGCLEFSGPEDTFMSSPIVRSKLLGLIDD